MRDSPVINCSLDRFFRLPAEAYMHIGQPTSRTPNPLVTENLACETTHYSN